MAITTNFAIQSNYAAVNKNVTFANNFQPTSNTGVMLKVDAQANDVFDLMILGADGWGAQSIALFNSGGTLLNSAITQSGDRVTLNHIVATSGSYYIVMNSDRTTATVKIGVNQVGQVAAALTTISKPSFSTAYTTQPAPTPAPAPTPTPTDAQAAADKLTVQSLKNRVKAGDTLIDDEAIMMKVGDSVLVTQVMSALDAGGNYDSLRLLGLSDSMTIDVLGLYNTKPDVSRYEREIGVDAIMATKTRLKDFLNYLDSRSIAYPNLNGFFASVRSNNAVYEAMRQWNKTRTV